MLNVIAAFSQIRVGQILKYLADLFEMLLERPLGINQLLLNQTRSFRKQCLVIHKHSENFKESFHLFGRFLGRAPDHQIKLLVHRRNRGGKTRHFLLRLRSLNLILRKLQRAGIHDSGLAKVDPAGDADSS